jgi:hypothetical protein
MMPDGDTAAHLRKQVGGLFLHATLGVGAKDQNPTSTGPGRLGLSSSFDLAAAEREERT